MSETTTSKALPRLISMDAMRGFAIFGIFMVNIQVMAMPFEWAMNPHYSEGPDVWAWAVTRTLFESNFVAIFSMLFGAGLILQMESAARKGVAFGPLYLRRLVVLMFMGLLHGTLLFLGDILLLCSDGLSGEVTDDEIRDLLIAHEDDLDKGVEMLIQAACDNGGKDNVTVVLVKYV